MDNPIISHLAGNSNQNPQKVTLSEQAFDLIRQAFTDLASAPIWDYHAHVLGMGTHGTGCWINPQLKSLFTPSDQLKLNIYLNAVGIDDTQQADQQYMSRMLSLIENWKEYQRRATGTNAEIRYCMLALDQCYDKNGRLNGDDTRFYVPNAYVMELSRLHPDVFIPCISVHPYRPDALEELDKWGKQGVKLLKWLPSAMGMDASDPVCDTFYAKMRQYNMVLLTHAGKEDAIQVARFKPLNNPLLFRRPLEHGLKVIMAHCAGLGSSPDLDLASNRLVKNHDLFLRLMAEPQYEQFLFGDISALTQINRCGKPLLATLQRKDIHHRLVNGSDYPLPAVNAVISIDLLYRLGYVEEEDRKPLNEIYKMNPLLFDFVLKRLIRDPEDNTGRFSDSIFEWNPALGVSAAHGQKATSQGQASG